jgi:hypothetical protein
VRKTFFGREGSSSLWREAIAQFDTGTWNGSDPRPLKRFAPELFLAG